MYALNAAILLLALMAPLASSRDSSFLTSITPSATTLAPPTRPQQWAAEQTAGASRPLELREAAEAQPREASPPETTEFPGTDSLEAAEIEARFKIITFTSCVTLGSYHTCGRFTPVIDASMNAVGRNLTPDTARIAVLIAAALGLLLSWV
ncbi:hypothetical protein GQ53DRAFT_819545 [Thozetella sp. PMI_491]|nr:hypothetical protein GQ53DRAFT_819545 [Thozetella sp. PMI_491]